MHGTSEDYRTDERTGAIGFVLASPAQQVRLRFVFPVSVGAVRTCAQGSVNYAEPCWSNDTHGCCRVAVPLRQADVLKRLVPVDELAVTAAHIGRLAL
jgi:hypothetical protein